MPDFQQFAEQIQSAMRAALFHGDGEISLNLDLNVTLLQAERHARLLQQIWEWAQLTEYEKRPDDTIYPDFNRGSAQAKAHIRSLLAGEQ